MCQTETVDARIELLLGLLRRALPYMMAYAGEMYEGDDPDSAGGLVYPDRRECEALTAEIQAALGPERSGGE